MTSVIRRTTLRGLHWPTLAAILLAALLTGGCRAAQPAPATHAPAKGQGTSPAAGQAAPATPTAKSGTGGHGGNVAPDTGNPACNALMARFKDSIQGMQPGASNGSGDAVCSIYVSLSDFGSSHTPATLPVVVGLSASDNAKAAYSQLVHMRGVVTHSASGTTVYDLSGRGVHGCAFAPAGSPFTVIDISLGASPEQLGGDTSALVTMLAAAYAYLAHP